MRNEKRVLGGDIAMMVFSAVCIGAIAVAVLWGKVGVFVGLACIAVHAYCLGYWILRTRRELRVPPNWKEQP